MNHSESITPFLIGLLTSSIGIYIKSYMDNIFHYKKIKDRMDFSSYTTFKKNQLDIISKLYSQLISIKILTGQSRNVKIAETNTFISDNILYLKNADINRLNKDMHDADIDLILDKIHEFIPSIPPQPYALSDIKIFNNNDIFL